LPTAERKEKKKGPSEPILGQLSLEYSRTPSDDAQSQYENDSRRAAGREISQPQQRGVREPSSLLTPRPVAGARKKNPLGEARGESYPFLREQRGSSRGKSNWNNESR